MTSNPPQPEPADAVADRNRAIELVYERLERIAHSRLDRDAMGRVVQTRSLVHETVMRLQQQRGLDYTDEVRVLAAAANIMGRVLIDLARKRQAQKRAPGEVAVTLHTIHLIESGSPTVDAVEFADALGALAAVSPIGAQTIQMRFWAEMSFEQMARALNSTEAEVRDRFNFAKAWLSRRLAGGDAR